MFLDVKTISKAYAGKQVLKNLNLICAKGETLSVLGTSGCGKTTLLKILAGIESSESGRVTMDGKSLEKKTAQQREVIYLFQEALLFPHFSVFENVAFGLRIRHRPENEIKDAVHAMLEELGLSDKAEKMPDELSGGQKQRVAIARALAMDPEILLFDEPTSALDPALVGEVLSVIEQLANEGRTMLLVTHEIGFAYHMATRIVFLAEGGVYETGTPDEVLKNPKRPRTQQFLADHQRFHF